jgi:Cu/Ag efflux protein CusF
MPRIGIVAFAVLLACAGCGRAPEVEGEVTEVDVAAKRITLNHEAIPNIPMPAMIMMFGVGDGKMISGLKPGDKVRFTADIVDGTLTVTSIQRETSAP